MTVKRTQFIEDQFRCGFQCRRMWIGQPDIPTGTRKNCRPRTANQTNSNDCNILLVTGHVPVFRLQPEHLTAQIEIVTQRFRWSFMHDSPSFERDRRIG